MELESKQIRPLLKKTLCFFMTALMLFSSFAGTFSVFAVDAESAESSAREGVLSISEGETKMINVYSDQITYIEFVPTVSGIYSFSSKGEVDTYGYLFDENLNSMAECDDFEGFNFKVTYELEEGVTYYYGARYLNWGEGSFDVTLVCDEAYCEHKNVTSYPAVDATCTTDGMTNGKKCEDCQLWLERQEVIPAGHTDSDDDFFCDACGYAFAVVTSGNCGDEGWYWDEETGDQYRTDNARYTLYDTGILVIEGEGKIGMGESGYDCIGSMFVDTLGDIYDCNFIKKIVIGEGITHIGNNMFNSNASLISVELPETLEYISGGAFEYCINLSEIYIPLNVENIEYSAFNFCDKLRTVKGYRLSAGSRLAENIGADFVTLDESEIVSIEIESLPFRTEFEHNGPYFSTEGLELRINYADGSSRVINDYFGVDFVDVSVLGEHKVNIYAEEFTLSYTINVYEYVPHVLTTGETTELTIGAFYDYGMYFTPAKSGTYRFRINAEPFALVSYVKASDYESGDWQWENDAWVYGNESWTIELQGGEKYYFRAYSENSNVSFSITPECIYADCDHESTTFVPGFDATCTTDGKTDGVKCNECFMWVTKQSTITAGHIDEDGDLICDRADCGHEFSILAEGYCGDEWGWDEESEDEYHRTDNARYTLYDTGLLVIEGEGRIGFEDSEYYAFYELFENQLGDSYNDDFIKKIVIKEGITTIVGSLFRDMHSLVSLELPESLENIFWDAFAYCWNLREVYIPLGVRYIDSGAFYECEKLETVKGYRFSEASQLAGYIGADFVALDENEVVGIEIETLPYKLKFRQYKEDEPFNEYWYFNHDGLKVKINYDDGSSRVIENYFSVDFPDQSVLGDHEVVITAGDFSTSYTVTVYEYVIPEITLNETEEFTGCSWDEPAEFYFTPAKSGTYRLRLYASSYADLRYAEAEYQDDTNWLFDFDGNRTYEIDLQGGVKYYFESRLENSNSTFRVTAECVYAECDHEDTTFYDAEEATCTQAGYTAGVKCNECTLWIEGHEKVTVPHTDDDSDNICDVCGNSMSDISVGETKNVEIISNEITYLRFIPAESGTYTFYAVSDEDTYGYICDSEKNVIGSDDDYLRSDFYVSSYLEAGETYYLGARYYSEDREGSFDVSLYFGDRSELSGWGDDDDDWDDDDDDEWYVEICENGYIAENIDDNNVCLIIDMTEARQKAYADGGDLVVPEKLEDYYVRGFSFYSLQDYDNDLRSITIPASVETIPYGNFVNCGFGNLEEIIVDPDNPNYKTINGVLYNYDVTEILAIPRAYKGVLTVPSTVQNVDNGIFSGINGITEVVFEGQSDMVFDGYVLYNADKTRVIKAFGLKGSYEMPESVTAIDDYAFSDLDELEEVRISPNVTELSYFTFYDSDALENVELPENLQSIGWCVFESCDSLKNIEFNEGLERIGHRAFNKSGLESVSLPSTLVEAETFTFAKCENLEEVNLGTGITELPSYMFTGCTALEEISFPENVTVISQDAFSNTGLKELEIPDNIVDIGYAFMNCDSLKSVVIGDGVLTMGKAFRGCDALEEVTLGKNIRDLSSAFYGCRSLKKVEAPEGFDGWMEYAFTDCVSLSDVKLPDTVQTIAYGQFRNCNSLGEFDMPENLKSVGAHSFDDTELYEKQDDGDVYFEQALYTYKGNMPADYSLIVKDGTTVIADSGYENEFNLKHIDLPDGLRYIGRYAFERTGVQTVIVPDSVIDIRYGAFRDCYDISDVYYCGTEDQWSEINIEPENGYLTAGNIHYEYQRCEHKNTVNVEATSTTCGEVGFTAGVLCTDCDEYISGHVAVGLEHKDEDFNGECDVCSAAAQEVFLTDGNIVYIGKGEIRYLKFVPEETGMYVLTADSSHVNNIKVLNDKYEVIAQLYDEYGYISKPVDLEAGEIYYFAVRFDSKAFKGEFRFEIGDRYIDYSDSFAYSVSNGKATILSHNYDNEKNLIIPDSFENYPVYELGHGSFADHYRTEKIEIPENVARIVYYSFDGCRSLEEVYLPSTIESIWTGAFDNCDNITDVYYNGTKEDFGNIRIEFDNEALLDANIHCLDGDFEASFTEGDFTYRVNFMGNNGTVTVIGYNGAGGDVVIPEKARGYDVSEISSEAFGARPDITSISIPATVTRIHHSAFDSCANIERVYITDIAKWCNIFFDYETATPLCQDADLYLNGELLTDVIIPEGVEYISNYAFYGCTSIRTVEIPESVTYIGWRTFNYCDTLSDVYYHGDEDMWNDIDFGDFNTSLENAVLHLSSYNHEHSFTEETVAPGCDSGGYTLYTCVYCGYNYIDSYEDALGHDYETEVTAPTCDSDGYTTYTCTRCDDCYEDDFTDALGHDYEAQVTEPTCQAGGYTTYTCTVCGNGYSDDFTDSIDHIYESVVTPPTCDEIGFTTHTCTMCGDVIENEGVDSLGHDYASAVTAPTCTEDGYTTYTCSRCNDSYTDSEVAATGHTPGAAATCTTAQKCTVCQAVLKEAKGHTEVTDKGTPATCTASGLSDGKHCSVCGEIIVAQTVINALGHNTVSHTGKAATCTSDGWKAYVTCIRCNYTTYTVIKALGHNYPDDFNIVYDASYKASGVKMKGCKRCNATTDRTEIPRLTLAKVKGLKATPDAKSIKFTWNKVTGAESYEVQYSTNGKKWTKVKSSKNSVTIKKLKAGTTYKVKVKAVAGTNNGAFSSVLTTSTEPSKVSVTKVTSSKSKQITVNWKKVSGATDYEVQYSTAKNFKKKSKTVNIKKQSTVKTTLKKLTKGKKYYIRVRAYKTVGKTKIYGSWSSVKNVKAK